jgi:hypothetical protein
MRHAARFDRRADRGAGVASSAFTHALNAATLALAAVSFGLTNQ